MTDPAPNTLVVPASAVPAPAVAPKVTLTGELLVAFDRALLAALGAFTGAMTVSNAQDGKSLIAAGIAAGTAALVSLGNSVRNVSS
jgi:hypothetical protein